jgi:SAM-dependent methyltransferase
MANGPPRIFDRKALSLHKARASRMDGDRFLATEAAEALKARMMAVNRRFRAGLLVDTQDPEARVFEEAAECWRRLTLDNREKLALDAERYDIAVSVLALHAVNDLPGLLRQIRGALNPDGLFLAAMLGGDTLIELRHSLAVAEENILGGVSPRVAPFADIRALGGLLQRAGFALPVADVERSTALYRDVASLVRDLRVHAQTNALVARSRKPLPRAVLAAALAHYQAYYTEPDGRVRATFEIVYLTGWAPHDSQQKPLAPGSGRMPLSAALKTALRSPGDGEPD